MTFDLKTVLVPLLALVILAVIGIQTSDALRHSGTWAQKPRSTRVVAPDPYARLEALLAGPARDPDLAAMRDPFSYSRTPAPARRAPARPPTPPPPEKPVLTGILADSDPRAFIRYKDHNYTVKPGDAFAEFTVVSITAIQVELDRKGERLTLVRPMKGD